MVTTPSALSGLFSPRRTPQPDTIIIDTADAGVAEVVSDAGSDAYQQLHHISACIATAGLVASATEPEDDSSVLGRVRMQEDSSVVHCGSQVLRIPDDSDRLLDWLLGLKDPKATAKAGATATVAVLQPDGSPRWSSLSWLIARALCTTTTSGPGQVLLVDARADQLLAQALDGMEHHQGAHPADWGSIARAQLVGEAVVRSDVLTEQLPSHAGIGWLGNCLSAPIPVPELSAITVQTPEGESAPWRVVDCGAEISTAGRLVDAGALLVICLNEEETQQILYSPNLDDPATKLLLKAESGGLALSLLGPSQRRRLHVGTGQGTELVGFQRVFNAMLTEVPRSVLKIQPGIGPGRSRSLRSISRPGTRRWMNRVRDCLSVQAAQLSKSSSSSRAVSA